MRIGTSVCKLAALLCAAASLAAPRGADAAITEAQVRSAWSDIVRIAEMRDLPLSIKEEAAPNAWVTAGESVTVTTGLMQILDREEEIFGVLSHEAGHACLNHNSGRVNNAAGVGLLAVVLGHVVDSSLANVAIDLGAGLATAGYSREQEVAADDFATDLAFKGHRDPTGLYNALERIVMKGGKTMPSGFNSHPPDERRLGRIERRIREHDSSIRIRKLLSETEVGWEGDPEPEPVQVQQSEPGDPQSDIDRLRRELGMPQKTSKGQ